MKASLGKKLSIAAIAFLIPCVAGAQEKKPPLELTLDDAIKIALSENPSVRVADLEVEKKKYAKKSAQSALYPQIEAVGQYSRSLKKQVMYMDGAFDMESMMGDILNPIIEGTEKTFAGGNPNYASGTLGKNIADSRAPAVESSDSGDGGISVGRDNNWSGGLQLNWPIIVPTLWKSLELSSLDVELAVESARSSKINMVNAVRKAYYGVLLAKDALQVFQESYDNAILSYNDINNKFKQGVVSEFDLIRADVNVKNIKPNLIQAQNAYNLATLSLKALMGIDMEQEISVPGSLLDYQEGLYAEILALDTSLGNNSDLKKFDIQTEQLQKTLQLYKAQYLPTIAITGNYTYMSMNNDFRFGDYRWNPYSTVSLNISIPIFDGFKKSNDIRQTKATLEQMKWQREDVVRNLQLAVNSDVSNMTNYVEQVFSTKDVVAQAKKGYEISRKLYDTGMGTLLDLNTAQLGLTQASLSFTQAIYNFLTSKADLDKTLGIEAPAIE
ncbi:MAG: TolC family protein [Dysgonamonadaceae bacterium]|jgi:outer membrane protein TolC|nr:TolC family protein [Dysgonamonadaceae bacterium]